MKSIKYNKLLDNVFKDKRNKNDNYDKGNAKDNENKYKKECKL